jgi:hypothetical protein
VGVLAVDANAVSVSSIGFASVWVFGVVGKHRLLAELIVTVLAALALSTGIDNGTNTDKITDLAKTLRASSNDSTDNFVASDAWAAKCTPSASHGVDIGSADTAMSDLDFNILGAKRAGVVSILFQREITSGGPTLESGGSIFEGGVAGRHVVDFCVCVCVRVC